MFGIFIYLIQGIIIAQVFRMEYHSSRFFSVLALCLTVFLLSFAFPFKTVFYPVLAIFLLVGVYRAFREGFNFDYISEISFAVPFFFFLFLRSLVPQAFGAEKLMDIAFMNSVLEADKFHPPDPFFAGGEINFYYYFGYVVGAATSLMSFTSVEIGFNLAIASIPAYFIMLSQGFLREILGDYRYFRGIALGTVFMAFSGNLYAVYEFIKTLLNSDVPGYLFYWNASRVVDDLTYGKAITEFPYFSFIHADFHAHFVALPMKLLAVAFLYRYFTRGERAFCLIPLSFILFATNSWDAPVFMLMILLTIAYRFGKGGENQELKKGLAVLILSSVSIILFYSTMETPSAGIKLIGEKTDIWQFFLHFGTLLLLCLYYLRDELIASKKFAVISLLIAIPLYFLAPVMLIVFPLALISFKKFLRGDFLSLLIFSASLLIVSCEFLAIESRMNTIFKFYLASWVFLSIPSAKAIIYSLNDEKFLRYSVIFLIVLSLLYPTVATPLRHYEAKFTLDSSIFIKERSQGDFKLIQLLKDKHGVVAESAEECYGYGGRIAALTPTQAVIAWPCHEVLWRANPEEISERMAALRALYKSQNCSIKKEIAEKYSIDFIVLGSEEIEKYGVKELKCFREVFRSGNTVLYSTKS
jgi:YYY domain-containing protein